MTGDPGWPLRGPCVELDAVLAGEVAPVLVLGVNALRAAGGEASAGVLAVLHACDRLAVRPLGVLSPAEVRVAVLVAEGKSNRAIAAELHVAARTVETHVAHACQKLGVANRTQLAVAVEKSVVPTMRAARPGGHP